MKHKAAFTVLFAAAAASLSLGAYYSRQGDGAPTVVSTAVSRGSLVSTILATGTLEAVSAVDVGTQVSGTVLTLSADFNSIVRKGQVIARLDPSLYESAVEQARANLVKARADLERLQVAVLDAQTKRDRTQTLWERQLVSANDRDAAEVTLRSAQAQVRSAEAQVTQVAASLKQAEVNLDKTVIASPIDGIVVARNVDVGQTVASSFQAPTLYVVAADLSRMQVKANVDEADVGQVAKGQPVRFTVDAYPNDSFGGSVEQVRLNPTIEQNVVTYAAIISAPNPDLKLRPGMTANATIEVARRERVLTVPTSALRVRPDADVLELLGADSSLAAKPSRDTGSSSTVWIVDGASIRAVGVRTGVSDATSTEILDGSIEEGARVVTRISTASPSQPATTSSATRSPLIQGPPGPPPGR